jgi:hypothetical protein
VAVETELLKAPSHDRAEPMFFDLFAQPWRSFDEHESVAGLEARLVTRDPGSGAATYMVRIPAGWRRTLSAEDSTFECFLLEGDLATGARRIRAGGFLAIPKGCGPAPLLSHGGATAYVFVNPDLLLPSYTAGIHSSNVWQEPFVPSALLGMRHGIAGRSLRVPDVRSPGLSGGPSGFLRMSMMSPGFAEPRNEVHHNCWEEIIIVAGDMVMGDRGRLAPGTVLSNPANLWHYPAASQRGCLMVIQTDAAQDVEFRPYAGGFELASEYLETFSWLDQPEHETWEPSRPLEVWTPSGPVPYENEEA